MATMATVESYTSFIECFLTLLLVSFFPKIILLIRWFSKLLLLWGWLRIRGELCYKDTAVTSKLFWSFWASPFLSLCSIIWMLYRSRKLGKAELSTCFSFGFFPRTCIRLGKAHACFMIFMAPYTLSLGSYHIH